MIKKHFILLIFIFSLFIAKAQNYISIEGKITEKETNKAIDFANISIKNKAIGTTTNADGFYTFHIPANYKNDSLIISAIGYENFSQKVSDIRNKKLNISLKSKTYELSEVIVKPKNALDIIKQAIAKIPDNYIIEDFQLNTFSRTLMQEKGKYVRLTEAAASINYASYNYNYSKKKCLKNYYYPISLVKNFPEIYYFPNWFDNITTEKDSAKILEIRRSKNHTERLNTLFIVGGPLNILSADKVKFRNDFMDKDYFKYYIYELDEISTYNGKKVYVINFKPKNKRLDRKSSNKENFLPRDFFKAEFKGKIYIEIESLAFVCFDYALANIYKFKNDFYQHLKYDVYVDYAKYKGRWYINQIKKTDMHAGKYAGRVLQEVSDTIVAYSQILVNNVITKDIEPLNSQDIFPQTRRMALFNYQKEYNPEFWKNYNTVIPTDLEKKIISDLSQDENLDNQFKTSQIRDTALKAPIAKEVLQSDTLPLEIIEDNYLWLRDYGSKEAVKYIVHENRYADNYMNPTRSLQSELFNEMLKYSAKDERIKYKRHGEYFYYEREKENSPYKVLCRKKDSINNEDEEILIDLNKLADKYEYFSTGDYEISPNEKYVEYWVDNSGNEIYSSFFYDIENNCSLIDSVENLWEKVWINEKSFVYSKDNKNGITNSIYLHKLGREQNKDELIFKVSDDFIIIMGTDKEKKNLFLTKYSGTETEVSIWDISNLQNRDFKIISPLRKEHLYMVRPYNNSLFILSNKDKASNQIFRASINDLNEKDWELIFPNTENEIFRNYELIGNFIVYRTIKNSFEVIRIYNYKTKESNLIKFKEPGSFKITEINEKDVNFKFTYSNLKIPLQEFKYNLNSHKYTKTYEAESKLDPKLYKIERIWVYSRDSIKIPVTLFYKKKTGMEPNTNMKLLYKVATKSFELHNNNKMLLTAYGSSGFSFNLSYNSNIIPLLNKNFVYAIAHVRGGSELGKQWHIDGSKLNKKNTFNDFIDCAEFFIKEKYTSPEKLTIEGISAGGTLIAAVINSKPELFKTAIISVPSINVVEAAFDTSYRLQQHIISELGNPKVEKDYNYMKSYNPYQNIKKQKYPNILLTSGYTDQRVKPHQSAMYIAKLRKMNTSINTILFKTNFYAGHSGLPGSKGRLYDDAYKYAFILDILNH